MARKVLDCYKVSGDQVRRRCVSTNGSRVSIRNRPLPVTRAITDNLLSPTTRNHTGQRVKN